MKSALTFAVRVCLYSLLCGALIMMPLHHTVAVNAQEAPAAEAVGASTEVDLNAARQALGVLDTICSATVLMKIGNEPARGFTRAEQAEFQRFVVILNGALDELARLREASKPPTP